MSNLISADESLAYLISKAVRERYSQSKDSQLTETGFSPRLCLPRAVLTEATLLRVVFSNNAI